MPLETNYETGFFENMEKVYRNIEKRAKDDAKIAKDIWEPDTEPYIIKLYTRQYYEEFQGDFSYYLLIFEQEIDKLFNE